MNAKIDPEFKKAVLEDGEIKKKIAEIEAKVEGNGRVLIRPSGTEPLIRVMLEGEDVEEIHNFAQEIADMITDKYGIK